MEKAAQRPISVPDAVPELTAEERAQWIDLSERLVAANAFRPDYITPDYLIGRYMNGMTYQKRDSTGRITAFGMLREMNKDTDPSAMQGEEPQASEWVELGTVYTDSESEMKGKGAEVVFELSKIAHARGKKIFGITKVPAMADRFTQVGFHKEDGPIENWVDQQKLHTYFGARPLGEDRHLYSLESKPLSPVSFQTRAGGEVSHEDFEAIAHQTVQQEHLLPVTADQIEASYNSGLAIIGKNPEGQVVAFCRLIPLVDGWYELGTVLTTEHDKKFGTRMYEYLLQVPEFQRKNILMTTTNPAMYHIGDKLSFVEVPRKDLPEAVWRESCTCSAAKTGAGGAPECALDPKGFTGTEDHPHSCKFYITPQSAARLRTKNANV